LPDDWVEEFHLHGFPALEKGSDGILVRACSSNTWDEVFSEKLPLGLGSIAFEVSELSGDDYLF
jgi:hypothetical protein